MGSQMILLKYFVLPNGRLIPEARRKMCLQKGKLVFSQQ